MAKDEKKQGKKDDKATEIWGQIFLTALGALITSDRESRLNPVRGNHHEHVENAITYADIGVSKIVELGN